MTDPKPLSATERRLLAHKPEAAEEIMKGRSELDRRRLARTIEDEKEREKRWASKMTNRGDVLDIIGLYNRDKILPLAARLDAAERALKYLTAPWWRRRVYDFRRWGGKLLDWLEARGITFYKLEENDEDAATDNG